MCECVRVCLFEYVSCLSLCLHMIVSVCVFVRVCVCLCAGVSECLCVCLCLSWCLCMIVSVCVCLYVLCVSLCMSVCMSLCVSVSLYLCVCINVSVCLCVCACLSLCLNACVYLCVCVSLYMCVFVSTHPCIKLQFVKPCSEACPSQSRDLPEGPRTGRPWQQSSQLPGTWSRLTPEHPTTCSPVTLHPLVVPRRAHHVSLCPVTLKMEPAVTLMLGDPDSALLRCTQKGRGDHRK